MAYIVSMTRKQMEEATEAGAALADQLNTMIRSVRRTGLGGLYLGMHIEQSDSEAEKASLRKWGGGKHGAMRHLMRLLLSSTDHEFESLYTLNHGVCGSVWFDVQLWGEIDGKKYMRDVRVCGTQCDEGPCLMLWAR